MNSTIGIAALALALTAAQSKPEPPRPYMNYAPVFSPDGGRLAFHHWLRSAFG